jgi:anti-sigma factor RsiW
MKLPDERHYTEEELLMHLLGEEVPAPGSAIAAHLPKCGQCRAVFQEYQQLQKDILAWQAPELPEEAWQARKAELMNLFREDRSRSRREGFLPLLARLIQGAWSYALENPLPTLGYVIVAVAFASERTITTFRLDRILPATNEVLALLRQVL